uniref:MTP large subunit lipid-binding domain-containing protein n=1 Tax=Electrophorus electricus TaxID=8005 RepID=A0A4W4DNJ5_ELEEL
MFCSVFKEEELMAGMSAMLLGVQIQPIIFFKGYADLLSKYFSAAEGPMNILSGNILVVDHTQVNLILQSGLETQVFFHGGLSVDMSVDLEFSLFSQESKSSVNNKYVKFYLQSSNHKIYLILTFICND